MATLLFAGCGRLGTAAGAQLAASGHRVYGLRRHWPEAVGGIVPLTADLLDGAALQAVLPTAIDVVVHTLTPSQRDEAGYRRAYLDTLTALLAQPALSHPQQRWVFVSSTAVYGDADGALVDEDTPPSPTAFNGRVLLQAEQLLQLSRDNVAILRLGGIYGPGREHMLRQLRQGTLCVQRDRPHYGNRIHAADAAGLLACLALHPARGVFNGVDGQALPEAELADWLAQHMGLEPPGTRPPAQRPNRRIQSRRLSELGYRLRHPDARIAYAALLA